MNWKDLLLKPEDTLRRALEVITASGERIALVVDAEGVLLGVITDGNTRRGLLSGHTLESSVALIMNPSPYTASPAMGRAEACRIMLEKNIMHLPVLDADGRLLDVWRLSGPLESPAHDTPIVLMVGGLGSRLGEMTRACPKPMLHVGGKPLLEIVLRNFMGQGFTNFYLAVHYLAEEIQSYFGDGSAFGCNIRYIHEQIPLGTAGALSLLPERFETVLVMNGDILTQLNAVSLLQEHSRNGAPATMVVKHHEVTIPYGVVHSDENSAILSIEEKPTFSHCVCAGINVLSATALACIPQNTRFDMPDVFQALLLRGEHPKIYLSADYWLDIGRLADYRRANLEFEGIFGEPR